MTEPFRIDVAESDSEDLRRRLDRTRLASPPAGEPWESGVDYGYLTELLHHWRSSFDWRSQERILPYYHGRIHDKAFPMVTVAVGVAVQWGERGFPRQYAERTYTDIRMWSELPRGGHFTAKQTPDLVATAMREFFAGLRD